MHVHDVLLLITNGSAATAKYHFLAWQNIASELNIDFTIEQNELLKGVNRENSLLKILEFENKSIDPSLFNSLLIKKNNIYLRYVEKINSDINFWEH